MANFPEIALLLAALPFCLIAATTDLKTMTIRNKTNIGLFLAFVVVGIFVLPLGEYGIRLVQAAVMLGIGILLMATKQIGGGDAKFLAAMAPYIAVQSASQFLMLMAAMALVTLAIHKTIGAVTPIRARLVGWHSWDAKGKFPFGVTLGASLIVYLASQIG